MPGCENSNNQEHDHPDNRPTNTYAAHYEPDDSTDSTGVSQISASGVHGACVHLAQIILAHDPGDDSADETEDDA